MKNFVYVLLIFALFSSFKEKEYAWVAIGDSITYLNDHTDETGNRVVKGYLTRVVEQFPNIRYSNQGRNGWTSGGIADQIDNLNLTKADVYTVFLGTNDWWAGRPVGNLSDYTSGASNASLYDSFRIILTKLKNLNPQAKIVLITPMQRGDFVYIADAKNNAYGSDKKKNGQSLEDFANAIIAIGRLEKLPVIDLYHHPQLGIRQLVKFKRLKDPETGRYKKYSYPLSSAIAFHPEKDDYPYPPEAINMTYDGLHPSDKGNAVIAREIVRTFRKQGLAPRWDRYIDLIAYNRPFWKADTIVDERVQILRDGNQATGSLLFRAGRILSVKTSDGKQAFAPGKDWRYANRKLFVRHTSAIPSIAKEDLIFRHEKKGLSMTGKEAGTFVLFSEQGYFNARQISVSYIPAKSRLWRGPIPQYAEKSLPKTTRILTEKKPLKIVFYGNSIETGYNASGFENTAPFMPAWPDLVTYALQRMYSSPIDAVNSSVPGKLASWGLDSVAANVTAYDPDLIIIGFGMNDGSSGISPDIFAGHIQGIMDAVSKKNPAAEFVLITPMLPNPDAIQAGRQAEYRDGLRKLLKPGVALADMTGVHKELLLYKSYQDMTGNNVNHPNDYLARWYAQMICGLLIKPDQD